MTTKERGKCFRCRDFADFYIHAIDDDDGLLKLVCPKCVYRYGKESYEEYRENLRELQSIRWGDN